MVRVILGFVLLLIAGAGYAQVNKTKPNTIKHKIPVAAKKPIIAVKRIPGTRVKLTTDSGVIVLRLYDKTPLHRDNFIKLVQAHYFDSLLFHRVIQTFMIQGGDPDSKHAQPGQMLGNGGPGYTIPAEFDTSLFHKRGVLAAAREGDQVNPTKASSGSQFYIVQGKISSDLEMNQIEQGRRITIPPSHRLIYKTIGGTPFLDMNYTVFGEVESGLDVIDKIASATKDQNNRPVQDIRMMMEILPEPIIVPMKMKSKSNHKASVTNNTKHTK